jgi:hypothetical protein
LQTNLAIVIFMGEGVPEGEIPGKLDALQQRYQLEEVPRRCWKRLQMLVKAVYPEPSKDAFPKLLQVNGTGQPSWLWGVREMQRILKTALETIQTARSTKKDSVCTATSFGVQVAAGKSHCNPVSSALRGIE